MAYEEALLGDLERLFQSLNIRVSFSSEAVDAMGALGDFVEDLHNALKKTLGLDADVQIGEWTGELKKIKPDIHHAHFSIFREIYNKRNLAKHPNFTTLTFGEVRSYFDLLKPRTQELILLLSDLNLVDNLYSVQQHNPPQRRGDDLFQACSNYVDELAPVAMGFVRTMNGGKQPGYAQAPPRKQLAGAIRQVAGKVGGQTCGRLRELAEDFLSRLPEGSGSEIKQWLIQDSAFGLSRRRGHIKIPCLRVCLQRDYNSAKYILTHAVMLEPALPGHLTALQQHIGQRIEPESLFSGLMKAVLNPLKELVEQALPDSDSGVWRKVVLQLEVSPECALDDFENSVRPPRKNSPLGTFFRALTVRPLLDGREIARLKRRICHPSLDDNSVAVWTATSCDQVYSAVRGRDCLIGGPELLSCLSGEELPTVVAAFDGYSCAVVLEEPSEEAGVKLLFSDKLECSWEEVLDTVTELRAAGNRVKVLWDDAQYDPPMAYSL